MAVTARRLLAQRHRFSLNVEQFDADASGTALLGRNGAGKTTLLLALQSRLPHTGRVERPARCAGVFSQPAVLHGLALWNVTVVARSALGLTDRTARRRAELMLSAVGLSEQIGFDARRLSSGQRQRLALARALVLEPQALFLDEPFANIDADGRPALRNLVREFVARSGCAVVLATQNLVDAATLCKHAILLDSGVPVERLETTAIGASRHPYLQALVAESRTPDGP